ncbi:unnamed protein product [Effrenium voratum]|nr:unnamed protein product [Effrenium voratum]
MLACLTSTLLKTNTTQPANEFDFCTRPRSAPRPMALKFAEIALLMWQVALAAGVSIDLHGRRDGRDVKIEDLKFEGMDAWTNVFKSVGRGEQADPSSLMKLAGIENATEPEQLDPQLKAELGQQSVQDRIRNLTSKPEMLVKVLEENPLVQQLAHASPMMQEIIHSPEALQMLFSNQTLEKLRAGESIAV